MSQPSPADVGRPAQAQNSSSLLPASKFAPRVAFRALKQLMADPEDTEKVFVILRSLTGNAIQRGYRRFRTTEVGQRALNNPVTLLDHLRDREALRALPAGSLGRAYLQFVESEQISADGLVAASDAEGRFSDAGLQKFAERQRDMHDLWHVLTRYGRDSFGEVCLLAFTFAQTWNPGIATIGVVGAYKTSQELGKGVWRAFWRGFADGRRAAWLPAVDWESMLARPIDEVRAELRITEPTPYQAVWANARAAA